MATCSVAEQALPGNAETMGLIAHMVGDQVVLRCERFELRFAADGRPRSFKLLAEGEELLDAADPGDGFVVVNRAGERIGLSRLQLTDDGRRLIARTADDAQEVVFQVRVGRTHIGFEVEKLIRFPLVPDLSLAFSMNVAPNIEAVPHNYMVTTGRKSGFLEVAWGALWNVPKGDSPGGFSVFHCHDAADRDDTLLHVWAEENIAHPAVDGTWTYDRAKAWLASWRQAFVPFRGQITLEGKTLSELYEGLAYAQAAGVSEVYLMPWIWRGEYWPRKQTTAAVNTTIFPRGEADLKAFADEVKTRGMMLGLHWVSAGIGFWDPKYVGEHPDRRLASWGSGTLAEAATADATTLRFRPAAGVSAPYILPRGRNESAELAPALCQFFRYQMIRVEDELVRFDELQDTDQPVWTLTGCRRGQGTTKAVAHPAGADAAGLLVPYNQNLIPDNWSTLLDELATAYAGLINRTGLARVNFDGLEIHSYYGGTGQKMAEKIYRRLEHPTNSNTSGGRAAEAWFEYRFDGSTRASFTHARGTGIVRLHNPSQSASSLLMADYGFSQAGLRGSLNMTLNAGDRGFHPNVFLQHGLHEQMLARTALWREIATALTPEQMAQFDLGTFRPPNDRLRQAGNYNEAPVVYVPEDRAASWALYPTAVMATGNQDSLWYHGQENGPIVPWRYVKANEEHVWHNSFADQPLRLIVQVRPATDYRNPANYDLQPAATAMTQVGDTLFEDAPEGLRLTCDNPRNSEVWNENSLPRYSGDFPADWSAHRALGLYIDGAGGGEVLVLSLGTRRLSRDYAVPIDFTGKRYIEIPCGEAAYALGKWGWRYQTSKAADYEHVNAMSFGFGYLPAHGEARVTVSGLKALHEIPTPLTDPEIATAAGTLQVTGTVPCDHYLEYQGGATATVYDADWNKTTELPVTATDFTVPAGNSPITVRSGQPGPPPWLAVQFLTRGEPVVVAKPETAAVAPDATRQQ